MNSQHEVFWGAMGQIRDKANQLNRGARELADLSVNVLESFQRFRDDDTDIRRFQEWSAVYQAAVMDYVKFVLNYGRLAETAEQFWSTRMDEKEREKELKILKKISGDVSLYFQEFEVLRRTLETKAAYFLWPADCPSPSS